MIAAVYLSDPWNRLDLVTLLVGSKGAFKKFVLRQTAASGPGLLRFLFRLFSIFSGPKFAKNPKKMLIVSPPQASNKRMYSQQSLSQMLSLSWVYVRNGCIFPARPSQKSVHYQPDAGAEKMHVHVLLEILTADTLF